MVCRRISSMVCAIIVLLCSVANAQQSPGWSETLGGIVSSDFLHKVDGLRCSFGGKKFFNSFTSYQFPTPFDPPYDPLSRLEFPIDQWFLGGKADYDGSRWSLEGQVWINVSRDSKLKMQDSDWDDDRMPKQKTIFSESRCRLNRGFLLDVAAGAHLPWKSFWNLNALRGLIGYRYEYFFFTTHDGRQMIIHGDEFTSDLDGDGIDFKQTFQHVYFGVDVKTNVNLANIMHHLPRVNVEAQVDYGIVRGKNEDFHLLREGDRVTTERTFGHCWHARIGLETAAYSGVLIKAEADFKRLLTHGSHQLNVFDLDFSFHGARVWSDQISISLSGSKSF